MQFTLDRGEPGIEYRWWFENDNDPQAFAQTMDMIIEDLRFQGFTTKVHVKIDTYTCRVYFSPEAIEWEYIKCDCSKCKYLTEVFSVEQ